MKIVTKAFFLEVNVQYPEKLDDLLNDLLFLPERMKIEKVNKLVAYLHNKKVEYVTHVRNLNQALDPRLVFQKKYDSVLK